MRARTLTLISRPNNSPPSCTARRHEHQTGHSVIQMKEGHCQAPASRHTGPWERTAASVTYRYTTNGTGRVFTSGARSPAFNTAAAARSGLTLPVDESAVQEQKGTRHGARGTPQYATARDVQQQCTQETPVTVYGSHAASVTRPCGIHHSMMQTIAWTGGGRGKHHRLVEPAQRRTACCQHLTRSHAPPPLSFRPWHATSTLRRLQQVRHGF